MRTPGFFRNKPLVITIALAVVLVLLIIFTSGNHEATAVESVAGSAVTPVNRGFYTFFDSISDFFTNVFNPTKAEAENVELKKELSKLREESSQMEELQKENQRLTELLGFVQQNPRYTTVAATVVGKDPGIWFDVFLINVGRNQGVEKDMAVVNAQGLVGRVIEAGADWSKVMAIIDARSSVGTLLDRSRDSGMVRGTFSSSDATGMCQMYYLDSDADVLPGDKVITSGLGGIFPKGLTVGEVVELGSKTEGTSRRVMVKPTVDFSHMEEVLVIKEEKETGDTKTTDTPNPQESPDIKDNPTPSKSPEGTSPDNTGNPDDTDNENPQG